MQFLATPTASLEAAKICDQARLRAVRNNSLAAFHWQRLIECSRPARRLRAKTHVDTIRHMKFSVGSTTYKWFGRTLDGPLFIRDLEHAAKFEEATKKEAKKEATRVKIETCRELA